ncbi:MAG TPA: ABC transporter permease [Acidimicrobiia bacterium]|jgi:peptide/nickel transport system permease protein|nr:ABC transporter permease [Acidimicrobiia bacterium]
MTQTSVGEYKSAWEAQLLAFEESQHRKTLQRLLLGARRNRLVVAGGLLGLVVLAGAVLGPVIFGSDYRSQQLRNTHLPPFSTAQLPDESQQFYLFGTDHLGRDVAQRLFVGIRVSLLVALGVTAISMVLGILLGLIGGFSGGWRDRAIRGITDFVWGFPLILVAVLFTGGFGEGLFPVVLAVGLVNLAAIARVVRGEVLVLKEREFIEAARAGGFSSGRIMFRHILPNILAPTFVLASYYVAVAIIAEAALSFIGLGAQPPLPSLGVMVAEGRNYLQVNHWESTIPGITVVLMVLSVSLIGDGLRDVFDPRLRHEAKRMESES